VACVGDAARRFRITHNSEGDTVKNHTPGPWEAHENGHIYAEERANAVARIFENYYHRDGEANANARLIAAAPDMLAALEGVVATYRTFRNVPKREQEWTPLDDEALGAAFSAINKAKGTK